MLQYLYLWVSWSLEISTRIYFSLGILLLLWILFRRVSNNFIVNVVFPIQLLYIFMLITFHGFWVLFLYLILSDIRSFLKINIYLELLISPFTTYIQSFLHLTGWLRFYSFKLIISAKLLQENCNGPHIILVKYKYNLRETK